MNKLFTAILIISTSFAYPYLQDGLYLNALMLKLLQMVGEYTRIMKVVFYL